MFFRRNPNPSIDDTKCDNVGCVTQCRMVKTPTGGGWRDLQHHRPAIGEFASVGKQILKHLLKPLGIGLQSDRQPWVQVDRKGEVFALRDRTKSALDRTADFSQYDWDHLQSVVNQAEQFLSRTMNSFSKFDLARGEVTIRINGQLIC